jgi:hypothetical protein
MIAAKQVVVIHLEIAVCFFPHIRNISLTLPATHTRVARAYSYKASSN